MSIEENKKLIRHFLDETNAAIGDINKMRSLYEKYCVSSFIHHDPSRGDTNLEQRIQAAAMAFSAFPDAKYSADDIVAEGDKVCTRYTLRATHQQPFMGIPPTGKQIAVKGANMYRLEGKKVAEAWDFLDMLGMMVQLGVTMNFPTAK